MFTGSQPKNNLYDVSDLFHSTLVKFTTHIFGWELIPTPANLGIKKLFSLPHKNNQKSEGKTKIEMIESQTQKEVNKQCNIDYSIKGRPMTKL